MSTEPTKHERIYLAGPMQGIPEFNFPRFHAVAAALRAPGHTVFSPAERDIERHGGVDISVGNTKGSLDHAKASHGFSLRAALCEDCQFICNSATMIALLPGWERSAGAQAEHRLAVALQSEGLEILYLTTEIVQLMEQAYATQNQQAAE